MPQTLHLIPWSYAQGSRAKTYILSKDQVREVSASLRRLGKVPALYINKHRRILSYHEVHQSG